MKKLIVILNAFALIVLITGCVKNEEDFVNDTIVTNITIEETASFSVDEMPIQEECIVPSEENTSSNEEMKPVITNPTSTTPPSTTPPSTTPPSTTPPSTTPPSTTPPSTTPPTLDSPVTEPPFVPDDNETPLT